MISTALWRKRLRKKLNNNPLFRGNKKRGLDIRPLLKERFDRLRHGVLRTDILDETDLTGLDGHECDQTVDVGNHRVQGDLILAHAELFGSVFDHRRPKI